MYDYYDDDPYSRRVMDLIGSDTFCPDEPGIFRPIYDRILNEGDYYFHLADFQSYIAAQEQASKDYANPLIWAEKALLNIARMAKFSSDRTILEYANDIWGIGAIKSDG